MRKITKLMNKMKKLNKQRDIPYSWIERLNIIKKYGIGEINQWNRIKSPEIDLHKYNQLIFDKGPKVIQWKKNSLLTNDAGTTGHPHPKKLMQTKLIPLTKINSKWIHRPKCKTQNYKTHRR